MEVGEKTGNRGHTVEDLVKLVQSGNMNAFDELVGVFQVQMYNLALRMVDNNEDAADLTQVIFVRAYRAIKGFQGKSKFSTWLFTLAINTCRSGLRKLNRISNAEVGCLDQEIQTEEGSIRREPADPGDSPGRIMERKDLARQIKDIIAELDDDFREVIILRDMQGLAYDEIAEILDCSIGTVKSRLARARTKIKDKLLREGLTCNAMI